MQCIISYEAKQFVNDCNILPVKTTPNHTLSFHSEITVITYIIVGVQSFLNHTIFLFQIIELHCFCPEEEIKTLKWRLLL